MRKQIYYTDDKGNRIRRGNVLYDTSNKKFYLVQDGYRGILISIEEEPKKIKISEVDGYLKLWINNRNEEKSK